MSDHLTFIESQLHDQWLRAQSGDTAVYTQLLISLSQRLRGFMRKRMQTHTNDIEDLVQETLMAVHQKRHTYDTQQPFTAWVYAIARYKWIDHLRLHGRRTPEMEDIDDWADVLSTESDSANSDTRHDLGLMLAQLPEKQRAAIEHTRLQGLSIAQTAAATGQSEAAVKVNVHRGLKALSERWSSP
jgi:RNA polymerase sigma-70 factor (ECF subfamily)